SAKPMLPCGHARARLPETTPALYGPAATRRTHQPHSPGPEAHIRAGRPSTESEDVSDPGPAIARHARSGTVREPPPAAPRPEPGTRDCAVPSASAGGPPPNPAAEPSAPARTLAAPPPTGPDHEARGPVRAGRTGCGRVPSPAVSV